MQSVTRCPQALAPRTLPAPPTRSLAWRLACILAGTLAIQACGGSGGGGGQPIQSGLSRDTAPQVASADAAALVSGNTGFALDLYQGIAGATSAGQNLFYSPYSVSLALAMTYAGAAGQTADQMATALQFTLPADRLHPAFDQLDLTLASRAQAPDGQDGGGFQLRIADTLFGDQSVQFQQPFLDTLARNYGAGVRVTDFAHDPEGGRTAVNDWVSQQTEHKIQDLLPDGSVSNDTRFVLVNAIYFNAGWSAQFDASRTAPASFTRLDGSVIQTDTMHQPTSASGQFNYARTDSYEALELPYTGNQVSMLVVAPLAGQFPAIEQGLDADFLSGVVGNLRPQAIDLSFPRFKVSGATISLSQQLQSLGMTDAFDASSADFSAMLDPSQGRFWLSDVLHKAIVEVDEHGTVAAAATGVVGVTDSAVQLPQPVKIDRPFFFVIRDVPTGTLLFAGRLLDPSQQ
jgi:serpin B